MRGRSEMGSLGGGACCWRQHHRAPLCVREVRTDGSRHATSSAARVRPPSWRPLSFPDTGPFPVSHNRQYDAETTKWMSEIFEEICTELGLSPREDRIRDTVAQFCNAWNGEIVNRKWFANAPGRKAFHPRRMMRPFFLSPNVHSSWNASGQQNLRDCQNT
jgi:hypothetical protein